MMLSSTRFARGATLLCNSQANNTSNSNSKNRKFILTRQAQLEHDILHRETNTQGTSEIDARTLSSSQKLDTLPSYSTENSSRNHDDRCKDSNMSFSVKSETDQECEYCNGRGAILCDVCGGEGKTNKKKLLDKGERLMWCMSCMGVGRTDCIFCFGTGKKRQIYIGDAV